MSLWSCAVVESWLFEHGPSERVFQKADLSSTELDPYRVDGSAVAAAIKESSRDVFTVWVSSCSRSEPAPVHPVSAKLTIGSQALAATAANIAQQPLATDNTAGSLRCRHHRLMDVPLRELLPDRSASATIRLDVEIEGAGQPRSMLSYEFVPRKERHVAFPT